jgi:hypothetical protein
LIAYAAYPRRYENSEEVWLARVGGGERRIARHEDPLGWTRAGLLLLAKGRDVIVRDSRGRRVRTLHFRQSFFGPDRRTLLALTEDGRLVRTDGRSTATVARVPDRRYTLSDVLDHRLIVLVRPGALLVLDRGGRRYASARFSQHEDPGGTIAPLPDGSLALPLVRVRKHDALDSVVVVRRGGRSLERLLTRRLPLSCGHWTNLTYRDGRLLYSSQGRIVLIDPTQRRDRVDLTWFAGVLAGRGGDASADWG